MNRQELLENVAAYKDVYIYGAGRNARRLYKFLASNGHDVTGFVVSSLKDNPSVLFECPVIEAASYMAAPERVVVCSVSYLGRGYNDIFETAVANNIKNIIFLSQKSMKLILGIQDPPSVSDKMQRLENLFRSEDYKLVFSAYDESNHTVLEYANDKSIYHWRIQNNLFYDLESMNQITRGKSILEEFREQYGEMTFLRKDDKCVSKDGDLTVYMVRSYVDKKIVENECPTWMVQIQAGGSFTNKRMCGLVDNEGDNISERNRNYSEGTAIYWLWKNAPASNYIGICQYRRRLAIDDSIAGLLKKKDIDILTAAPTFLTCDIKTLFADFLPRCDIDVFLMTIKECAEEYYADAVKFFSSRFYPPCNLFVMKHEIFQKYAEKVFNIAFGVENYYAERNIVREDRYMGYLIECFLGIFIMKHKYDYNVACSDMLFLHSAS